MSTIHCESSALSAPALRARESFAEVTVRVCQHRDNGAERPVSLTAIVSTRP